MRFALRESPLPLPPFLRVLLFFIWANIITDTQISWSSGSFNLKKHTKFQQEGFKWSLKLIFHATFTMCAKAILGWTDFYQNAEPHDGFTYGPLNCSRIPTEQTLGVELSNVKRLFDGDEISNFINVSLSTFRGTLFHI